MTLKVDLKDPSATASGARKAGSTGATRPSGRSAGAKPPAAGRKRQRRGGIERPGTLPKRNVSPRSLGATRSEPRLQTNQVETNRQPEAQGIGANCPERARSGHRKVPATPKKRSGGGGIAPRPDQSREHRPPPRRGLVPPGTDPPSPCPRSPAPAISPRDTPGRFRCPEQQRRCPPAGGRGDERPILPRSRGSRHGEAPS
jgi:hypothetical protein